MKAYICAMENIEIVRVGAGDIDQLQDISRRTFLEAFSAVNSEENMRQYLDQSFSVAKLGEELRHPQSQFYFAIVDGQIVAYLKINTGQAQTELKDKHTLEIERIYVLQAYHGKKVAQQLYDLAIDMARAYQAEFVWLGVWEENARAISFYTKNGFSPFDKHSFWLGDDEQTDLMMKKML